MTPMSKITIYSTPDCVYCKMARKFFNDRGIVYEEYDVSVDAKARTEMEAFSHQLGVPVIVIGDEVFVGFDRRAIATKLGVR